jgi:hypothetical protein
VPSAEITGIAVQLKINSVGVAKRDIGLSVCERKDGAFGRFTSNGVSSAFIIKVGI